MNKVFLKYIAWSFWGPFFFGLGVFVLIMLFGSLFDRISFFMKSSSDFNTFLKYLLYQLPYFIVKMMPIATLLAVLFALSGMISRGEWKAGMAGGWRPFEMVLPLLACSAAAAALQLGVQETVAPSFFMKAEYMFEGKMRGRGDWKQLVRREVSFSAGPEIFVTAHIFDGGRETMERVLVNVYEGGRLSTEINAARAVWDKAAGVWVFENGVLIKYGPGADSRPATSAFANYSGPLRSPPDSLILERLVPDGVSIRDIAGRIRRLEAIGAPVVAEKVQLYSKLAGPLANIVLAVTGLAFVLIVRMNRVLSFGIALATGFFFWVFMTMGQYAGEAELLPPALAGFGPALVFLAVSFLGLRKARVF
ncbi:MAG: LptF/LptG family permease [Elusimicrobiales bacterium]|jgi:lipopolysaccharide export system permease protein